MQIDSGRLEVVNYSSETIFRMLSQVPAGYSICDAVSIHLAKKHNACLLVNSPCWQNYSSTCPDLNVLHYTHFGLLCNIIRVTHKIESYSNSARKISSGFKKHKNLTR